MSRERILIASGHAPLMTSIRILLQQNYQIVHMVSDYQSLCDASEGGRYDTVIVDLSMICSSGDAVNTAVRSLDSKCGVILLSRHDVPTIVEECLAAGARGFVLQRTAVTELLPAVEAVLRGDVYVSPLLCEAGAL